MRHVLVVVLYEMVGGNHKDVLNVSLHKIVCVCHETCIENRELVDMLSGNTINICTGIGNKCLKSF